jgi:hypothetical protein
MFVATLQNASRPDIGNVDIYFPIEEDIMMSALNKIGITSSLVADCLIKNIDNSIPALKILEGTNINADEMNYLAKRLDSFVPNELTDFQGAIARDGFSRMKDLINLTFCVSDYVVITSFSNLETVGRNIYLAQHGGLATVSEMEHINFSALAFDILSADSGAVSPYGVVFKFRGALDEVYDGRHFPRYEYTSENILTVGMVLKDQPYITTNVEWLYMPMPEASIEKAMLRVGADTFSDVALPHIESATLPDRFVDKINTENESLRTLNDMCIAVSKLDDKEIQKLDAVADYVHAVTATQIRNLAEKLDLFDFIPEIQSAEEYGRHMIKESGHFEFDENLAEFYDYKKYGEHRLSLECGNFSQYGYICYNGKVNLYEIINADNAPRSEMAPESFPRLGM